MALDFLARCCGGLFATTSTARSNCCQASGRNSILRFDRFIRTFPLPTHAQFAASQLYANIMTEIKIRIAAINTGTMNQLPIPPPLVKEFAFLQFRMICELIALGCLTAHGDISATKKLRQAWEADKIIESLEALHPDFFPVPVTEKRFDTHIQIDARVQHPMPKTEFLKLYRKCGETLHRGSVKKLLSEKSPVQIYYPDITAIAQKLQDLLTLHQVSMFGGKMHFICVLFNASDNMNVQVANRGTGRPRVAVRPH